MHELIRLISEFKPSSRHRVPSLKIDLIVRAIPRRPSERARTLISPRAPSSQNFNFSED